MAISITEPLSRAFDRAALITFKPFDIGKWFVLGFVAWLANLGEGGGGNYNFGGGGRSTPPPRAPAPFPGTSPSGPGGFPAPSPAPQNPADQFLHWLQTHILEAVLIGVVIMLIFVFLTLLIIWINSRGRFMFLRAIALNRAEVRAPWTQFRALGNSLFRFRVVLIGVGLLTTLIIGGICLFIAWTDIQRRDFGSNAVAAIVVGVLLFLPTSIVLGLINWVTNTFVPTIMYATGANTVSAWREFRANVMPGNIGKLVLFLLMQFVVGIAVVLGQVLIGCVTCCIGFLPYIGTVITLPFYVFLQSYSIYFLQQFDPRYVIIQDAPQSGFPVMGIPYPPPEGFPPQAPPGPGPYSPPM